MDIGYEPDQQITPWGTASETKSESHSGGGSSSSSSGWSGWNAWQKKLGDPWTGLGNKSIDWISNAYSYGQPRLRNVVSNVLGWTNSPPVEYQTGWDALANSFRPTATQEFYERSVRDPALREWQQVTLPGLQEAYAGNYYHGDRMRRQAELARDLALNLANKRADLEYQSQEAAKQRALQGAPVALQYAEFIPKTQANFLQGYMQSTNPLLTALTEYLSRMLEQRNRSSSSSSHWSNSLTHSVSGFNPQPEAPAAPEAPAVGKAPETWGVETSPYYDSGGFLQQDITPSNIGLNLGGY